jgi:hypothetical protein
LSRAKSLKGNAYHMYLERRWPHLLAFIGILAAMAVIVWAMAH